MLDALKRKLGGSVEAETAYNALQAEFEGFKVDANALLEASDAALAETKLALEQALAKIEELKEYAEAAEAAKAALIAEAEAKRLADRKAKIEAAVGTERAPALLAAFEDMDDAKFEMLVSALGMSVEAEAKTAPFNEVGAAAEVDAAKVETNGVMSILKKEYGAK